MRIVVLAIVSIGLCVSSAFGETVNLKDKPYFKLVDNGIKRLSIGNNGAAELTDLIYDTNSYEIRGKINVRVAHSWGTVGMWNPFRMKREETDVGVDASGDAEFYYNTRTRKFGGKLEVPLGERSTNVFGQNYKWNFGSVKLDSDIIMRAIEGDIGALFEAIPNLGTTSKEFENNYASVSQARKRQYGGERYCYFASPKFAEEVKPSSAAGKALSLIVSGGASSEAIAKELSDLMLAEVENISKWLKELAKDEAQNYARELIQGRGVRLKDYFIAVKWQTLEYRSRTLILQQPTPWISENHGAFYIVIMPQDPNGNPIIPPEPIIPGLNGSNTTPNDENTAPQNNVPGIPYPDLNSGCQRKRCIKVGIFSWNRSRPFVCR